MEYLAYSFIALTGAWLMFMLATSIFQDQVSRATEALFDSIEYSLAVRKSRRGARLERSSADDLYSPAQTPSIWSQSSSNHFAA
ncbi:MAG: hypothetical protein H0W76_23015 [Pyrinomonadaceae bacterium]|nr:hypothetical protein [Pyrinomonadaceae bacterium]